MGGLETAFEEVMTAKESPGCRDGCRECASGAGTKRPR